MDDPIENQFESMREESEIVLDYFSIKSLNWYLWVENCCNYTSSLLTSSMSNEATVLRLSELPWVISQTIKKVQQEVQGKLGGSRSWTPFS